MIRPPPRSTRPYTPSPYTTVFRPRRYARVRDLPAAHLLRLITLPILEDGIRDNESLVKLCVKGELARGATVAPASGARSAPPAAAAAPTDRKSTRLNSSH